MPGSMETVRAVLIIFNSQEENLYIANSVNGDPWHSYKQRIDLGVWSYIDIEQKMNGREVRVDLHEIISIHQILRSNIQSRLMERRFIAS